jgi:hypothetical protein
MWLIRGTWVWALGFALLVVAFARSAAADAVTAEALFRQGREAMQKQDYATARARFAESNRLESAAGTLMNLATCEEKLGQVATAWQHWREAIDLLPAGDDRIAFAQQRLSELKPRLPGLTLVPPSDAPADMVVLRDGVELGSASLGVELPVDPGEHEVVVRAKGYEDWSTRVSLGEREVQSLDLELGPEAPVPPPAPPVRERAAPVVEETPVSERTLGFIAGGVGVVGVLTAVGSYIGMLRADSIVKNHCDPDDGCDETGWDARSTGKTLAVINDISWGVAAVGLGVGAILVLTDRGDEAPKAVGLAPMPSGAALSYSGRF